MSWIKRVRRHFVRKEVAWKMAYIEKRITEIEADIAASTDEAQIKHMKRRVRSGKAYLQSLKFVLFACDNPHEANKIVYRSR